MAGQGGDCCDRAQELLDKVPPCTSKAFNVFFYHHRIARSSSEIRGGGLWALAAGQKSKKGVVVAHSLILTGSLLPMPANDVVDEIESSMTIK